MNNSVQIVQELIRCKSITPENAGSLEVVESYLKKLGFNCQRYKFEDVDNLFAKLGSSAPHFLYAGHVDVVPEGALEKWSSDPFAASIMDGNIIGRGAVDMKGSIGCFIAAVISFVEKHKDFKGSISLLITGDEESVAINGTQKVLPELKSEKFDLCLVGEPTCREKLVDVIKIGRRGSVNFNLTINGIQGHVAYPHLAKNPNDALLKILSKLNSHEFSDKNEFFDATNLEVTSIDVGNKTSNIIPQSASAKFNIRYNNTHSGESLIKWVGQICAEFADDYILKNDPANESFINKDLTLAEMIKNASKKITGIEAELNTEGGTSDARFLHKIAPTFELGLRNKYAHKIDEQVSVKEVEMLSEIYQQILTDFFIAK